MSYPLEKIILFEYDTPINLDELVNAEAGIWSWKVTNTFETFTDDHENEGYYEYVQETEYSIKSLNVDNEAYSKTISLEDCRDTNKSFYYDSATTKIYIHFDGFEPPLAQSVSIGAAIGYSKLPNNKIKPYFEDFYYEPRVKNVPSIKKSVDPLFFGLLKYFTGSVTLHNQDGEFDEWRSRNLFGQPARVLVGNVSDDYTDYITVMEGYISNDNRTFDEFTVEIEDPRKALTQPVAQNTLNTTDWMDLNESNVGAVKPIAYGTIKYAPCICLNEDGVGSPDRRFLLADTEFNVIESLDAIYVDGALTAITGSEDLAGGTFTMTNSSVSGNLGNVTADFTATDFDNGVEVIKDLMLNYDFKPFNSSFWDLTEVNAAELTSRDTSLYVNDGSTKLSDAIESVCVDIDGRFFIKNSGLYTLRIYNASRTPNTKEIQADEWLNTPSIKNNASEYLSSVIIEYSPDLDLDRYLKYENTDYQTETFNRYKKLKVNSYKTNLPTLADAQDKSETIMNISKLVQDIVDRKTTWDNFGIEPSDFILASPAARYGDAVDYFVYEVMSVSNNLDDFTIGLSLRFVVDYIEPEPLTYGNIEDTTGEYVFDTYGEGILGILASDPLIMVDENDNLITDENDNSIVGV